MFSLKYLKIQCIISCVINLFLTWKTILGKAFRYCNEGEGWGEPDLFGCTTPALHKLAEQVSILFMAFIEINYYLLNLNAYFTL